MKRNAVGLCAVLGLLPFILAGNCTSTIPNQKPKSIFKSGSFPESVEKIANPLPEGVEPFEGEDYVSVAIVGDGVDYRIAELKNKIDYSFNDQGEVIGVGADFLGGDKFAHPDLVDVQPFAFGAELERGRIAQYDQDLLRNLDVLNEKFLDSLIQAFAQDELLQKSLFSKIDRSNINLIGAIAYLKSDIFELEKYEKNKERSELYNFDRPLPDPDDDIFVEIYDYMIGIPWGLSPHTGLPLLARSPGSFSTYFHFIEHADRFDEVFKQVTFAFMKEYELFEAFERFKEFYEKRPGSRDRDSHISSKPGVQALGQLALTFYKYKFPYERYILEDLNRDVYHFCQLLTEDQKGRLQSLSEPNALKKSVETIFDELIDQYVELDQLMVRTDIVPDNTKDAASRLKHYDEYRRMVKEQLAYYGYEVFNCNATLATKKLNPKVNDYIRTFNPPFKSAGETPSKSTELAGAIALNNEHIKIFPIRVSQNDFPLSRYERNSVSVAFLDYWMQWLDDDVVLQGVLDLVASEIPDDTDLLEKSGLKKAVLGVLSKKIALDTKESVENFYLLQDLIDAVRTIGKEEIPLAFVHTTFAHEIDANRLDSKSFDLEKTYQFLKFELYKYHISKAMIESGKNTLFVFPSGQDGEWVDGESRSTLPCQLKSPYFEPFEDELGKLIPNHKIKNVLCVGGISKKGELMGNSNMPLDNTPFMLANAELMQTFGPKGSCVGNQHVQIREKYRNWGGFNYLSPFSAENFIETIGKELGQDQPALFLSVQHELMNRFYHQSWRMACAHQPDHRAFIRGTAVAASRVIAKLGDLLYQDRNLKDPEKLLDAIFAKAQKFGGNTFLRNTPALFELD